MTRYSSDSDSDSRKRSSKKSKKKSKSRKRSRSTSYESRRSRDSKRRSRSRSRNRSYSSDRSGRSRSRDDRKRRHRSRSEDSYRSRRSYKRSRSRSPRRRRSRSRSNSRDRDRYSRKYRSRSRSRERSKKKKKTKKKSRELSPVEKEKKKDPCEDIPGFAEMTPAQQSRLRVQAALNAADATQSSAVKSGKSSPAIVESAIDQMERAQVIEDIEDSDFMPTHFSSSRSNKNKEVSKMPSWPSNLAEQEDYHEMAIFGNSAALSLDEKTKKEISEATEPLVKKTIRWEDRDPKTLAHPNLHITHEEAEKRWLEKLNSMRREKLKSRGI